MNVLVLNCGSSSLKFQIVETDLDLIEQLLTMFPLPTAARSALRHDQAAALPVDLDDLNRNHLSDEGCQVSLALIRRHFARQGRAVRCGLANAR